MRGFKNLAFGQRLRSLIGEDTQVAFAKKVGITQPQLAHFLTGHVPGPEILLRISEVTGRSINWLLTGEEAPMTAAKEKAEALAQTLKDQACIEYIAEGPGQVPGEAEKPSQLVEAIKELLPPAFGDRAGLLISLIDYLEKAPEEERETVQGLIECLSGGSEEVRHHLINQLKLIKRLTDLEKKEGPPQGEAASSQEGAGGQEERKRAAQQ